MRHDHTTRKRYIVGRAKASSSFFQNVNHFLILPLNFNLMSQLRFRVLVDAILQCRKRDLRLKIDIVNPFIPLGAHFARNYILYIAIYIYNYKYKLWRNSRPFNRQGNNGSCHASLHHEKYIYSILARKERKERKKERKKLPSTTHPSIQIHMRQTILAHI